MTDEEFNRYCAEVMGYATRVELSYIVVGHAKYHPATDLNQMAEVFDKLWETHSRWMQAEDFGLIQIDKGIAQAMREFIESTRES